LIVIKILSAERSITLIGSALFVFTLIDLSVISCTSEASFVTFEIFTAAETFQIFQTIRNNQIMREIKYFIFLMINKYFLSSSYWSFWNKKKSKNKIIHNEYSDSYKYV
jgi:hypothetical protein